MPEVFALTLSGCVLCFDYGEKRTGVAVGESALGQAHPLAVIKAGSDAERLAAIGKLIKEWQPEFLVIGRPTHADGTPHDMTARVHEFALLLHEHFGLPVREADFTMAYGRQQNVQQTCIAGA